MTEETVNKFENTLNELKKPLLLATEPESSDKDSNSDQDMNVLNSIQKKMDELYVGVKELVDNNGEHKKEGSLDKYALFQIFERKGIFTALKGNPELKPLLLRSLAIFLKEYPFTYSVQHIHKILGTPSHQVEIIPNEV